MNMLSNEGLSDYELMRKRNVETNKELLRYLNLQDSTIDLDKESTDSNLPSGSNPNSPRSKKKFRKSPLPPTRPRSMRLREREERLKSNQNAPEPNLSPTYYEQIQQKNKRASRKNAPEFPWANRHSMDFQSASRLSNDFQSTSRMIDDEIPLPPHMTRRDLTNEEYRRKTVLTDLIGMNDGKAILYPRICHSCGDCFLSMNSQVHRRPQRLNKSTLIKRGKKNICVTFFILMYATWEGYHNDECCKKAISKLIFIGVAISLVINAIDIIFFTKDNHRRQL